MKLFTHQIRVKLFSSGATQFISRLSARQMAGVLSLLGIATVIFAALWEGHWALDKALLTVLLNVGGALTASAITAFLVVTYNETGRQRRMLKEFLEVRDLSKDIAIVLPRFPSSTTGAAAGDSAGPAFSARGAIKNSWLTNRYVLAFDDVAAVRHISAMFIERGAAPPRIEFDDDVCLSMFDASKGDALAHYKTFIVVGLFSNDVTVGLATRPREVTQRCFKLSPCDEILKSKRAGVSIYPYGQTFSTWEAQNPGNWDLTAETNLLDAPDLIDRKPDFALIAKCRAPDGRTCLVVGGGRARGTRKAGSYLRRNWQMLFEHPGYEPGSRTGSNAFASAFRLGGERGARLQPADHRIADSRRP